MIASKLRDVIYVVHGDKYVQIKFAAGKERDIFWYLFDHPNQPIKKQELVKKVWGLEEPTSTQLRYPENYPRVLRKIFGWECFPHYSDNKGYVLLGNGNHLPMGRVTPLIAQRRAALPI
jgi:hypothetical protein